MKRLEKKKNINKTKGIFFCLVSNDRFQMQKWREKKLKREENGCRQSNSAKHWKHVHKIIDQQNTAKCNVAWSHRVYQCSMLRFDFRSIESTHKWIIAFKRFLSLCCNSTEIANNRITCIYRKIRKQKRETKREKKNSNLFSIQVNAG